jgi:hypothetical protein
MNLKQKQRKNTTKERKDKKKGSNKPSYRYDT